jgi:hypothetical protein
MRTPEVAHLQGVAKRPGRNSLIWLAFAVVFIGAAWFGFASCGGYAWHKKAFLACAIVAAGAALVLPSQLLTSHPRRCAFLGILVGGYFLIEAAVAPFYPGPPETIAEYIELFRISLSDGPCG